MRNAVLVLSSFTATTAIFVAAPFAFLWFGHAVAVLYRHLPMP